MTDEEWLALEIGSVIIDTKHRDVERKVLAVRRHATWRPPGQRTIIKVRSLRRPYRDMWIASADDSPKRTRFRMQPEEDRAGRPCPECGSVELCQPDCWVAPWNIDPPVRKTLTIQIIDTKAGSSVLRYHKLEHAHRAGNSKNGRWQALLVALHIS